MPWYVLLFWVLLASSTAYGLIHGGGPERACIAMLMAAALLTVLARRNDQYLHLQTTLFLVDAALLFGLFWLALTADRMWPIWAFSCHLLTVLGHVVKLASPHTLNTTYAVLLMFSALPTAALPLIGTWRHRRRLRRRGVDPSWSRYSLAGTTAPGWPRD